MNKQTRSTKLSLAIPSGSIIDRARDDICRLDFVSFVELVFNLLSPGRPFLMNWHIQAIAYHLELVRLGRITRLIINLPPRFLKSLIASVAFPAFTLGHDPTKRIVGISYGLELATKFAHDSRLVMSSQGYKRIFHHTRLVRCNESEIVTTRTGYRLATSMDATLTGFGGDIIIIDDPLKLSDAESDTKRNHVNKTFRDTIESRLDNPENGAIIIVMQRLHADDLCGSVLQQPGDWTVLQLPLIAERDEQIPIGQDLFHLRHAGDLLHREYFSHRVAEERRSQLDEKTFSAQYQQSPLQPMGVMIKRETLQRYDHLPVRTKSHYVLQSWDTAIKTDPRNDYSVCVTLLVDEQKNYHVVDVLRERLLYHELTERAISLAREYNPDTILVEDAVLGRALVKELKAASLPAIAIPPEGDKLTRMSLQLPKFAKCQVLLPRQAPWLADLEAELLAFPNGRHDDQVDALGQGLAYKRPAFLWSDAALKGYERFNNGLMWDL